MMDNSHDKAPQGQAKADIEQLIDPSSRTSSESFAVRFKKARKRYNIPLLLMMTVIVVFGLIVLYSVSGPDAYGLYEDSAWFLKKQIAFTVAGYVLCLIISFFPVKFFESKLITLGAAGLSFALVVATMLFGENYNGAKRWITIGPIDFQSSEVIKVALVLAFAGYCSARARVRAKNAKKAREGKKQESVLRGAFFDFIVPVGIAATVDVLILVQPHVSCFIIIALIIMMCALSAGIPLKSWITGILVFAIVGAIGGFAAFAMMPQDKVDKIMKNYAHVFKRVEIYNDDESSQLTSDDTRQVDNAHNALGSGGLWGAGIGNSRSKYNYIAEAQNDYIFSVYVEETGFVGGLILILMYLVMFVMCLAVIMKANTPYTRILSTGCTSLIFVEFLLNLSVELQIIPSTGVTLPFFSYGGTAQVMLLVAMGFVLCVSRCTIPEESKAEEDVEEELPAVPQEPVALAHAQAAPQGAPSVNTVPGQSPQQRAGKAAPGYRKRKIQR